MTSHVTRHAHITSLDLAAFAQRAFAAVVEWNDRRRTQAALSRLNDRMLDDIGLTRGDVDSLLRAR